MVICVPGVHLQVRACVRIAVQGAGGGKDDRHYGLLSHWRAATCTRSQNIDFGFSKTLVVLSCWHVDVFQSAIRLQAVMLRLLVQLLAVAGFGLRDGHAFQLTPSPHAHGQNFINSKRASETAPGTTSVNSLTRSTLPAAHPRTRPSFLTQPLENTRRAPAPRRRSATFAVSRPTQSHGTTAQGGCAHSGGSFHSDVATGVCCAHGVHVVTGSALDSCLQPMSTFTPKQRLHLLSHMRLVGPPQIVMQCFRSRSAAECSSIA